MRKIISKLDASAISKLDASAISKLDASAISKLDASAIKYSNEPIEAHVVRDFLPKPESLILKERKTRVTLTLTQKSLDFFKDAAKTHGASYQAMIRRLLDYYVANQNV